MIELKRTRQRGHKCLHDGCDWHITDLEVLCHVHLSKLPRELAKTLAFEWRDASLRYGFARTNKFNEAWAKAKEILRGRA